MKKLFLSLSLVAGLLAATSAFAVTYAPGTAKDQAVTSEQSATAPTWQTGGNEQVFMPCQMMQQGDRMVFGSAPCGNLFYGSGFMTHNFNDASAWFGLMFVITVVLVWIALLLLIALLWKMLCKHKQQ